MVRYIGMYLRCNYGIKIDIYFKGLRRRFKRFTYTMFYDIYKKILAHTRYFKLGHIIFKNKTKHVLTQRAIKRRLQKRMYKKRGRR